MESQNVDESMTNDSGKSREALLEKYLGSLPYVPYPVQEEAIWSWFSQPQGVMVCAPTGTGKTLIAEAALFDALHSGKTAYYTTPLIALTDQKYEEIKTAAVRWGFSADDVGLVTGNRKVNPQAKILVVVAEILLNRLLHQEEFDFANCHAVVMDEFHSFNDVERGVVWELSLALLPLNVRLMLLSATVGNAVDFSTWLQNSHLRRVEIVQGTERKVPLSYRWVGDEFLPDQLEIMAVGDEVERKTPCLVFCFNRAECWNVAELLKGKALLADGQQKQLAKRLEQYDMSLGVGPKLKQILMRGVGVHHAGILPRYRKIVEELFQKKLLTVCVCTETLAAGINLPARSVVMTSLLKGPPGKEKLVEASSAHQIFGRAGRPQFDKEGFVYAIAHEDDVRIHRWKLNYDTIPEDTKDPLLLKKKKELKKKMPTRNPHRQYWNDVHLEKLRTSPPAKLASRGMLPWRLLGYLLKISPEISFLQEFVRKRMLDAASLERAQKQLIEMLVTLHEHAYIQLDPAPIEKGVIKKVDNTAAASTESHQQQLEAATPGLFSALKIEQPAIKKPSAAAKKMLADQQQRLVESLGALPEKPLYEPKHAKVLPKLDQLLEIRSVNPLYGIFLLEHLGKGNFEERLQALESLLEMSGSVAKLVRVPWPDNMPFGPLAKEYLNGELLSRGLATQDQLIPLTEEEERERRLRGDDRKFILSLAEKLKLLFNAEYPNVHDHVIVPVWCIGELRKFDFKFFNYVRARDLTKEEGSIFRHCLRMILLLEEFKELTPIGMEQEVWRNELQELTESLTKCCQEVDPQSTCQILEVLHAADVVEGESHAKKVEQVIASEDQALDDFGTGLMMGDE